MRGLDYYRHTAFEFVTDRLGAQGTVLGGGRYDGLIENLGGTATPAVGWAAGIERLAMLVDARFKASVPNSIGGGRRVTRRLLQNIGKIILKLLRKNGMASQLYADGNVRKRYDKAQKWHPDYVIALHESMTGDVGVL